MSARLIYAIKSGTVIVQNRTSAEVALRYVGHDKKKTQRSIPPKGEIELCPKLCPANFVKFSNVKELIARNVLRIKDTEKVPPVS